MISHQTRSLQQLANQCAGFKPPPGTPRVGTKQSQRCFLQAHVVQGLSALSVMLGQTASHLILAILTADTTRRATRPGCCSHTPMLTERAASPWLCARLCAHVDCMQLTYRRCIMATRLQQALQLAQMHFRYTYGTPTTVPALLYSVRRAGRWRFC